LSDIGLPDGSGYDVIAQAKRNQRLKGVALTGFWQRSDIRRGQEAGFDFHLIKPVDFHELRSVLRSGRSVAFGVRHGYAAFISLGRARSNTRADSRVGVTPATRALKLVNG